jgi:D-aminopeptidase
MTAEARAEELTKQWHHVESVDISAVLSARARYVLTREQACEIIAAAIRAAVAEAVEAAAVRVEGTPIAWAECAGPIAAAAARVRAGGA